MDFKRVYRFCRFLSLDIVLGVVSGSILACRILNVNPPFSYKSLLPLAVWILYLSDHIIDGIRQAKQKQVTRYQKYYNRRRSLLVLIIFLILLSVIILVLSFDRITFKFGLIVGIIVLGYFIFQQLRFSGKISVFPKEPAIAIIYTAGIWSVPLLISKDSFGLNLYIVLFSFALIVLMNVQLYSILQAKEDKAYGYPSLAGAIGINLVYALNLAIGIIISLLNLFIILWPINDEFRNAGIIFLGMDVSLFILSLLSRFSISKELLGILADATFFIPFTILLFQG